MRSGSLGPDNRLCDETELILNSKAHGRKLETQTEFLCDRIDAWCFSVASPLFRHWEVNFFGHRISAIRSRNFCLNPHCYY